MAEGVAVKKSIGVEAPSEVAMVQELTNKTALLSEQTAALEQTVSDTPAEVEAAAHYYHDAVLPAMEAARATADKLEVMVGKQDWPFPSYSDLLFYV